MSFQAGLRFYIKKQPTNTLHMVYYLIILSACVTIGMEGTALENATGVWTGHSDRFQCKTSIVQTAKIRFVSE